ncbi:MAG: Ig-like domain-containing protein [Nocardioides sp.]
MFPRGNLPAAVPEGVGHTFRVARREHPAKIKIKVKVKGPDFQMPSGKVILKKGAKTLTSGMLNNNNGVVVLKTKALALGKNKLTAIYKGDGYTTGSRDNVVVKVTR